MRLSNSINFWNDGRDKYRFRQCFWRDRRIWSPSDHHNCVALRIESSIRFIDCQFHHFDSHFGLSVSFSVLCAFWLLSRENLKFASCFRCKVPECEVGANIRTLPYNQTWLSNAIPLKNDKFESCVRFAPRNSAAIETGQCDGNLFDTKSKIECSEFVYASDERNLQTEVRAHDDSMKFALFDAIATIFHWI